MVARLAQKETARNDLCPMSDIARISTNPRSAWRGERPRWAPRRDALCERQHDPL